MIKLYHNFKQAKVKVSFDDTINKYIVAVSPRGKKMHNEGYWKWQDYVNGIMATIVGHIHAGMDIKTKQYEDGLLYAQKKLWAMARDMDVG